MSATIGHTTTVAVGTTTDATNFTTIAIVKSVTPPKLEVTDVDVTNLDSANYTKEFLPGLIDGGEIQMTVSFDEAPTSTIMAHLRTAGRYWKVTLPTAAYWMGLGYMKSFGTEEVTSEGEITTGITVKMQTKPTYTTA